MSLPLPGSLAQLVHTQPTNDTRRNTNLLMFLEQSIISPTGSTAPGDPTTPAATNYPHTHTPNPNPSAASSPETTDDPETCALTPPPTTSTRFTALLSTNAASLTLARHSRTGLTTHLHTLTAQKDALLHKLQDTMTTPTPHYTATSYDDGLMATHSLLTACREAESDLAYNWLELYQLRSQRAALLAAREAEIQRLQKLIEEGEREVRMLNGIVGVLGCRWPGAPVEVRYEGIYGGEVEEGMVRGGEVFFKREDAERCLVWVRGQMGVWRAEWERLVRGVMVGCRRGLVGCDGGGCCNREKT